MLIEQDDSEVESEFFWAIMCFVGRAHRIRNSIIQMWKDYREGKENLIATSLKTNIAIELVRQAEVELQFDLTWPKNYPAKDFPVWNFPEYLLIRLLEESAKKHSDFCFVPVFHALDHYMDEPTNEAQKGVDAPKDDKFPFSEFLDSPELIFDAVRVKRCIKIFAIEYFVTHVDGFAEDSITQSVKEMFATSTVPFSATFSMQVFLDIEEHLGDAIPKAFEDTRAYSHGVGQMASTSGNKDQKAF